MALARAKQVNPDEPGWYHCNARCVRPARLCGFDPVPGISFGRRKLWIQKRLADLERRIGIAIGKAAELTAEAARRGTQRVVSALKVPIGAEPATV